MKRLSANQELEVAEYIIDLYVKNNPGLDADDVEVLQAVEGAVSGATMEIDTFLDTHA